MIMYDTQTLIREISNHKPVILWLIGFSHTYIKHLLIFQVRGWLIVLLKRNSLVYKHWYSEFWWLKEQKYEIFSGNLVPQRLIEAEFNVKREQTFLLGTFSGEPRVSSSLLQKPSCEFEWKLWEDTTTFRSVRGSVLEEISKLGQRVKKKQTPRLEGWRLENPTWQEWGFLISFYCVF